MRYLRPLALLTILIALFFISIIVYRTEVRKRKIKEDLVELSKVKYGLFNVDEWKKVLAGIVTRKVEEFNFEMGNKDEMRTRISQFLHKLVSDLEKTYFDEKSQSVVGMMQANIAKATDIFGVMKSHIPEFTGQVLDFMSHPENRDQVRNYIINKLNEYASKTFSEVDYTTHDAIVANYRLGDRAATIEGLQLKIFALDKDNRSYLVVLFILVLIVVSLLIFRLRFSKNEFLIFVLMAVCLLLCGLMLPMIDVDARISSMSFTLFGEPISFKDQVLYYKSKSILEVVNLMLFQDRIDLLVVGILVLLFSVIFPVSKLIASILYVYFSRLRSAGIIKFMVFKTGKWSMADVMVIAIFMSYIGFSGIITEQLRQLESIALDVDVLTTNRSSLQAGFYLFTSFVILSLLISHNLKRSLETEKSV
jgi:hypothetical protein